LDVRCPEHNYANTSVKWKRTRVGMKFLFIVENISLSDYYEQMIYVYNIERDNHENQSQRELGDHKTKNVRRWNLKNATMKPLTISDDYHPFEYLYAKIGFNSVMPLLYSKLSVVNIGKFQIFPIRV
jgi:hypothetical protein